MGIKISFFDQSKGERGFIMYIEQNANTQICTIWVDQNHVKDYKQDFRYEKALSESKEKGYAVCVYVGGEMPLIPVIDDKLPPSSEMA